MLVCTLRFENEGLSCFGIFKDFEIYRAWSLFLRVVKELRVKRERLFWVVEV